MMIIIHVYNDQSRLEGYLDPAVSDAIRNALSYKSPGYNFSAQYNTFRPDGSRVWDGNVRLFKWDKTLKLWKFPTGMISKIKKIIEDHNKTVKNPNHKIVCKYSDHRTKPEENYSIVIAKSFTEESGNERIITFRDYQSKAIEESVIRQRGIIKVATGGGKTIIAAGIISALKRSPTIFYVLSKDLMYQAIKEFRRFIRYNGLSVNIGQVGDGVCDIQDINVCTIQTCARALGKKIKKGEEEIKEKKVSEKYRKDIVDLVKSAKVIIVDEVHHVAADMCQDVVAASTDAIYRYGLSASPWRDDGLDMLIESCFGRHIVDISATQLIEQGYLIRPKIYFVPAPGEFGPFKTYHEIYDRYIVKNEERNAVVCAASTKLVNDGNSVLVLVRNIEHGENLAMNIPGADFISGRDTTKTRKNTIEDIKSGKRKIVVASTIADEGLDIPNLSALILAGSGKSSTRALQRIGRVLRPDNVSGKTTATIIDFRDKARYLNDHYKARKRIYKTEPGFEIIEK